MRSRGRESQVLDGYEVMWREATGKVVFSRRLERAFDCIFGIKNKNQEIYFLSGAARGLFEYILRDIQFQFFKEAFLEV